MCVSAFLRREEEEEEEEEKKKEEEKNKKGGKEERRRKYIKEIKEKGDNYKFCALPKMTMKQSDGNCDSINRRRAGSNKKSM